MSEDIQQVVQSIADQLGETEPNPLRQIKTIVEVCGTDFAQMILAETQKIEVGEGLLVTSGQRRRTPGGVFFYLARGRMTGKQRYRIFGPARKESQTSALPAFDWEKRRAILAPLLEAKGMVTSVKITLIGRPGKVETQRDLIIIMVEHVPQETPLPKGVPTLPLIPTVYVVYIGAKQWQKVKDAIQDPYDELLIEGICVYDPELPGLAIHSQSVTTLALQRRKRDDQTKQKGGKDSTKGTAKEEVTAVKPVGHSEKPPAKRHLDTPPLLSPAPEVTIPANAPPEVAERLRALHTAAATYRQKVEATLAKPEGERFGLAMTQKLLTTTEKQIRALEDQYA